MNIIISFLVLFMVVLAQTSVPQETPALSESPKDLPQNVSKPSPQDTPKNENKIDHLYRISRLNIYNNLAQDFFLTELESKKSLYPKEVWPFVKEAGELTQKNFYIEEQIKKRLHASLAIKEIEEIEKYFNDPKVMLVRETAFIMKEDLDPNPNKENVIHEYIKTLGRNTPRRSLFYLIDSDLYRHGELYFAVAKLEALMKLEAGSLDVSKNKKTELAFKMKKELEELSLGLLEQSLDEYTYYYQNIEMADLKFFYQRSRTGAVLKFYEIIHSAAIESLQLLGKKFGQHLKEIHRSKTRPKI